ncbi:MAG: ester cyclase [Pyrinomonadaceae bacterium]|nr:ester cyclase [Pyrinomonadaceae bacterium]
MNPGNLDLADELVLENAIENEPLPGVASGRDAFKQFFSIIRDSFPDARFDIKDMIAEGDRVEVRLLVIGTHGGEFMSLASTGKKIEFESIDIFRCEDPMLAEHWGETDTLGLMSQTDVSV